MGHNEAETKNRREAGARYQPLVLVLIALSAGILCDRYWPISVRAWLVLATGFVAGWFLLRLLQLHRAGSVCVLLAFVALGGLRHHWAWHMFRADDLGFVAQEQSQPIVVEVTALSSPRWSPKPPQSAMSAIEASEHSELPVWIDRKRLGAEWHDASGYSILRINGPPPKVHSGDRLRIFGSVYAPAAPLNPGEMDFAAYERAQGRLCLLSGDSAESVEKLSSGSGWSWRAGIEKLRDGGIRLLWNHIRTEDAALASALLLNAREQLDQETTNGFFLTGIIHVLAISGWHVSVLAFGFWWLTRFCPMPRWATLLIAAALVIVYAILTDAQAPVARAAVLVICICAARWIGRPALAFNTLAAAGIAVLLLNPSNLFQVGAQLSFLAVAALACWNPLATPVPIDPLDQLLERTRPWPIRFCKNAGSWFWRGFLTSAMVWAVTTPLVWYRFQLISPVALLLNPAVVFPTTFAMYSGFAVLVLGTICPPLANLCGWLCGVSLGALQACIDFALLIPGNYWFWPRPALWWVLVFYAILGLIVAFPSLRPPRRAYLALWLVSMLIGVFTTNADFLPRFRPHSHELHCTFIAVGHGTAALLEFPNGKKILYDAGRVGTPENAARPISAALWSRGVTHLDAVIVSHADADHYNAIPILLRRFPTNCVYVSPMMFFRQTDGLAELRNGIATAGVPVKEIYSDTQLTIDDTVHIRIVHPTYSGVRGSDNANSIVLVVEYAGRRIILPGDLEQPGLEKVVGQPPLDADIAMAPHHGSKRSNPEGFARWSTPDFVVISGPRGKDVPEVRRAYEKAGGKVFHTATDGAVTFTVTKDEIRAVPMRRTPADQ